MTSPADFRVATCNAKKELGTVAAASVINKAASVADVILWQEIETSRHRKAVKALSKKGWATYWPGGSASATPISWRTTRFHLLSKTKRRLNKGRRFKYPTRNATKVVLQDRVSRMATGFMDSHFIQQTTTAHKEWRPAWRAGANLFEDYIIDVLRSRGAVIGGLDANDSKYVPEGTTGVRDEHGTHGSAKYDLLFYVGNVQLIGDVKRIPTASDHDMLLATFRRTA